MAPLVCQCAPCLERHTATMPKNKCAAEPALTSALRLLTELRPHARRATRAAHFQLQLASRLLPWLGS